MMLTTFAKHVYLPALDRVKRTPFRRVFREAERNTQRSRAELEDIQRRAMREIVEYAKHSCPYYARTLAGVDTSTLDRNSFLDLPVIGKPEVYENHEAMLGSAPVGRVFSGSTSGSTGIPIHFYQDSVHFAWVDACQWRGRRWWGVERGDLQLVFWSRPADNTLVTSSKAWLKYRLRNCLQVDTFQNFDDTTAKRLVRVLEETPPRLIYGYGSSVSRFAERLDAMGVRLEGARRPRMVEYTADHMYPKEIEIAERVFGVPIATGYGASECGGVAQQCTHGSLHLSVDHAVYEVIRPDGSATDPGEVGEIVLTTLHNRAMPLIRYRIGDLGAWLDEPCACGRSLPLMKLQAGKSVDLVNTSFKRAVSAHVLDYINLFLMREKIRGIKQFRVDQHAMDEFELRVVREDVFEERSVEIFVAKMREYFGTGISVRTTFVGEIPLEPTGKRRYFKRTFTPERAVG